jgi:hypothetical protein
MPPSKRKRGTGAAHGAPDGAAAAGAAAVVLPGDDIEVPAEGDLVIGPGLRRVGESVSDVSLVSIRYPEHVMSACVHPIPRTCAHTLCSRCMQLLSLCCALLTSARSPPHYHHHSRRRCCCCCHYRHHRNLHHHHHHHKYRCHHHLYHRLGHHRCVTGARSPTHTIIDNHTISATTTIGLALRTAPSALANRDATRRAGDGEQVRSPPLARVWSFLDRHVCTSSRARCRRRGTGHRCWQARRG